jgi:hypothetical protein
MEVLTTNKSVFIIIVMIYLLGIYDTPRHVEARICSNREGVQIATYVPAGKRRWSKMVLLHDGGQIPYGIWARCSVVILPSP